MREAPVDMLACSCPTVSPTLLRRLQVTLRVVGLGTRVQCLVAPQEYLATLSDMISLLTMLEEEEENSMSSL